MSTKTKIGRRNQKPNRRKLTQLLIDKVQPSEKRVRIWDTVVSGLLLQVEPTGAKSLYAYYRRDGRSRWYRLGAANSVGLSIARDVVRNLNAKLMLDASFDPQVEKAAGQTHGTVSELFEIYLAGHFATLKSGSQGAELLQRNVLPTIGQRIAKDVRRADIRAMLNQVASAATRKYKTKEPINNAWTDLSLVLDDVDSAFGATHQNIGARLGEPSGWLVDVDLDCAEAVMSAFPRFTTALPPKPAVNREVLPRPLLTLFGHQEIGAPKTWRRNGDF